MNTQFKTPEDLFEFLRSIEMEELMMRVEDYNQNEDQYDNDHREELINDTAEIFGTQ